MLVYSQVCVSGIDAKGPYSGESSAANNGISLLLAAAESEDSKCDDTILFAGTGDAKGYETLSFSNALSIQTSNQLSGKDNYSDRGVGQVCTSLFYAIIILAINFCHL